MPSVLVPFRYVCGDAVDSDDADADADDDNVHNQHLMILAGSSIGH